MTIRKILMASSMVGALGVLSACQPAVPDSGAPGRGVGFDTSPAARAKLDAPVTVQSQTLPSSNAQNQAVQTGAVQPAAAPAPVVVASAQPQPSAAGVTTGGPGHSVINGRDVVNASPSNPAPVSVNNSGISDENDFGAVSGRQSIESDKARIAANRAQYAVVQATALPSRDGTSQPNVVAYALAATNPRGTQVHRRSGFSSAAKTTRNCAAYASADEAQIDFLARGGPVKDRLALDPDGDGYACGWDPAKYRR